MHLSIPYLNDAKANSRMEEISVALDKLEHHSIQKSAIIPVEALIYHKLASLKNMNCRVNFYKCGDKLPEPHFLSWQDM